jgi:SpoVK/Ycf46/Vps4 family AAA+-type ATPase
VPSPGQRLDILQHLLIGVQHSLDDEELKSIAQETHGFVGADLAALCNEAAFCALRRYISLKENSSNTLPASFSAMSLDDAPCTNSNAKSSESYDETDEKALSVNSEDFKKAKTKVRPSAMREVSILSTQGCNCLLLS